MKNLSYITKSLFFFFCVILSKSLVLGFVWHNIGIYSKSLLIDTLIFSLIVGVIWEAPWYLIYFTVFISTMIFLRKYYELNIKKIFITLIIMDIIISYKLLHDFDVFLKIYRITLSEIYDAQVVGGFRFIFLVLFSMLFGIFHYNLVEQNQQFKE